MSVKVEGQGVAAGVSRVLLVDDHPLMRDGLRQLLSGEGEFAVCGEAGTLHEALLMAVERLPDLILLDLHLPGCSGLDLLEEVRGWADPPKVLLFSACDDTCAEAMEAFRLGAVGFVGKGALGDEILSAVRGALAGRRMLPDAVVAQLIRRRH